jgi:hypothetical protein
MAAIYLNAHGTPHPCHRRLLEGLGEELQHASTLDDVFVLIDQSFVPLVLLSDDAGYSIGEVTFPLKARHSLIQVAVMSTNRAPNRLPSSIDAWICVSDHEEAIRHRIRGMLATAWNAVPPQIVAEYLAQH